MMAIAMSLLLHSWKVKTYTSYDLQLPLKGSLCLTNSATFALQPQIELIWMSCCVTTTDINCHYPTQNLSKTVLELILLRGQVKLFKSLTKV